VSDSILSVLKEIWKTSTGVAPFISELISNYQISVYFNFSYDKIHLISLILSFNSLTLHFYIF
jgi:hypothetical protein